ncbi:MAG: hypothetical protein K8R41_09450, partial [Bacteroidales bacterium]|nr:hypothetical protein [Bacteroidales bacterium]
KKRKKEKLPRRHEDTKIHKEHLINIISFVNSLSFWVFVAKITFRSGLNIGVMKIKNLPVRLGKLEGYAFKNLKSKITNLKCKKFSCRFFRENLRLSA